MANFFTKTNKEIAYAFRKPEGLNRKQLIRRHRGRIALAGLFLVLLQLVATILFGFEVVMLDILPMKYLVGLLVILGLLVLYTFTAQFNRAHILGKLLAVLMTVVLGFGVFAGSTVNATLSSISVAAGNIVAKNAPFVIFISGSDEYGKISAKGRSDVNLLAVINPETRQVLLLSTPRDYYITISRVLEDGSVVSGKDKLTHAGNSGIEYSMKALSDLYGIDINYYYKINFTGCVNVIDALGGITINSSVAFTNGWEASENTYTFVVGDNECDGEKTLAFVRERKAFSDGDIQRGKNQEAAITAMIKKITSPSILVNYSSVLDAVSNMVLTNMPTEMITTLIKSQLSNSTEWNIQSYSVGAKDTTSLYCELYGFYASCVVPDYDDVNMAIQLANKIMNDEVFDVEEFVSAN